MKDKQTEKPDVEIIDEYTTITLVELCRTCEVDAELVEAMVDEGILEPLGRRGTHWCFPGNSLRRTRITMHLQRDLGVNLAGAALALDLLERIENLDNQLRAISGNLDSE